MFFGPNAGYVAELFDRYLQDPHSVDPTFRSFFEGLHKPGLPTGPIQNTSLVSIIQTVNYVHAIRTYGHMNAQLDPLGHPPVGDPSLSPQFHGITEQDMLNLPPAVVGGPLSEGVENAFLAIQHLREVYCTRIGYDYGHIRVEQERDWLRDAAETGRFRPPKQAVDSPALLERLTQVEVFEQFIHRYFPGKTRFSIEGVDLLIPMLDEIACRAADATVCSMLIGMAHRGRLNVLAHVLEKSYGEILSEFRDPRKNFIHIDQLGWTGDVKYHKGASHAMREGDEIKLIISMAPNPSHLEHINPVIEGMARALGSITKQPGVPEFFPLAALPILIHGDAAFPGEGINSETLNLSRLPGYSTAGSIHVITNNQLGYTTTPVEGRSTLYASDLAKGFEVPILHVNADDPVACLEAARTAIAYRLEFRKDFMIDLVGYRRYGHNEGDEPSFTQPLMYAEIEQHPSIRTLWAERLVREGVIPPERPQEIWQRYMDGLQKVLDELKPDEEIHHPRLNSLASEQFKPHPSKISIKRLTELNQTLMSFPQSFHVNHKLERPIQRRKAAFTDPDQPGIDWGAAEELAFATILTEGIPIRLTGQDVERGTFSQRHAVFHDVETGEEYIPLQALPQARATFDVHNSPLSENAAIGFEFGYSIMAPRQLVIWEAQYGDFINSAQPIIDEFVTSALAKWEQKPSLVLLLPHGYEGQGPDHSSGRPERFLQTATATSMRVANCTTSAQYYHLLRLQAETLETAPIPLVVFTPKSLLRHPLVASSAKMLATGRWNPILDDPNANTPDAVKRLLFCTGKIAVDLASHDKRDQHPETAIIRIEQLLPFPEKEACAVLDRYAHISEVNWIQEEPENMGWWAYIRPHLQRIIQTRWSLGYIGRAISSSPAEGSYTWHSMNQSALIDQAFLAETRPEHEGVIIYKG